MKSKIFITGAAGFIGFHSAKKFKKLLKWKPKHNDINKIIKSSIKWEKKLNSI